MHPCLTMDDQVYTAAYTESREPCCRHSLCSCCGLWCAAICSTFLAATASLEPHTQVIWSGKLAFICMFCQF